MIVNDNQTSQTIGNYHKVEKLCPDCMNKCDRCGKTIPQYPVYPYYPYYPWNQPYGVTQVWC